MSADAMLLLPFAGVEPQFGSPPKVFGAGVAILGRVTVARGAEFAARAVLRADGQVVVMGDDCHVGARSTLHITHDAFACITGDRVVIGADACVHACTIGSDVAIGNGVVILDGSTVGDNVVFEDGALVFPGRKLEGGFVYAGAPAKPVRPVGPVEVARRSAEIRAAGAATGGTDLGRHALSAESTIDDSVYIAGTARVRGRLVAGAHSSIFFSNELDAGTATITIGENTNIQDNTRIVSQGGDIVIGRDTTVGHNVWIADCVIGNHALIGIGSTVSPGTVVEDHVLLAAGARTSPGQVLESGYLYAGDGARRLAPLDDGKRAMIAFIVAGYREYARAFKAAEAALVGAQAARRTSSASAR